MAHTIHTPCSPQKLLLFRKLIKSKNLVCMLSEDESDFNNPLQEGKCLSKWSQISIPNVGNKFGTSRRLPKYFQHELLYFAFLAIFHYIATRHPLSVTHQPPKSSLLISTPKLLIPPVNHAFRHPRPNSILITSNPFLTNPINSSTVNAVLLFSFLLSSGFLRSLWCDVPTVGGAISTILIPLPSPAFANCVRRFIV